MVLWLRFLKEVNEDLRILPEELQKNKHIRRAAELCEEAGFTSEELASYEKFWDIIRTEHSIMESSIKKGIEQGIEQGKRTTLESIVVEGKLNGFSLEQIQLLTKLEIEQIIEILKRHGVG